MQACYTSHKTFGTWFLGHPSGRPFILARFIVGEYGHQIFATTTPVVFYLNVEIIPVFCLTIKPMQKDVRIIFLNDRPMRKVGVAQQVNGRSVILEALYSLHEVLLLDMLPKSIEKYFIFTKIP